MRALHVHRWQKGKRTTCSESKNVKIALIAKPLEGETLKELKDAVADLRKQGHIVRARLTFDEHDALRFARAAAQQGADLIIAAGGDGTVNKVVNGMVRARNGTPALAVLPLGTANDFAKGLQIPPTIEEAMRIALDGQMEEIDVARVNGRCFINVSTGGFGPDITESASSKSKRRFGKLAYLFTAVHQLSQLEPMRARFEMDAGVIYEGPFFFFAVGNARHTGGGTPVTPRADYRDAKLDLAIVTGERRRDFLTLLPDLRAGRHVGSDDVQYVQARSLRITAIDPFAVNADGEPVAGRQFRYRILDRTIRVLRGSAA